jgi:hypothetical protein
VVIASAALAVFSASRKSAKTWTDPEKAVAEDKDFTLQGEYAGEVSKKKAGVQLVALGEGKFAFVLLQGGLPGEGWDAKTRTVSLGETADHKTVALKGKDVTKAVIDGGVMKLFCAAGEVIGELKKVARKSPTDGARPPEGAVVLFDGKVTDKFAKAKKDGDLLCEGTNTTDSFKGFKLHMEFRMPYKPSRLPSNQDRGNSGVYTYNRYETQLLDTFGMHYNHFEDNEWAARFTEEMGTKPQSDRKQWSACFYKFKTPDVNMTYPPLAWQTYDIDFTPPVFEGKKKVRNARITVLHNGVKVHDDVEMVEGGTGAGKRRGEIPEGQIFLQGHGNPVRFRNMWILEKK